MATSREDNDDDIPEDRRKPRRRDDDDSDEERGGRRSRRRQRHNDDNRQPPKKAFPWKILLIVGLSISFVVVLGIGLGLYFAVRSVREAASRVQTSNNLKLISLGAHTQAIVRDDSLGKPFVDTDAYNKPFIPPSKPDDRLSWRVGMLPFVEQDYLYRQFKLNEAWNSPANNSPANTTVKVYCNPGEYNTSTHYRCFYDNGAMFDSKKNAKFNDIKDGTSNTIMYVESTEAVRWAQFNDFRFDPQGPLPSLGHPSRNSYPVAMGDGSVIMVRKSIDPEILKRCIHASDGAGFASDLGGP